MEQISDEGACLVMSKFINELLHHLSDRGTARIVEGTSNYSMPQLKKDMTQLQHALLTNQVITLGNEERILLLVPNSYDFVVAYTTLLMSGAVVIPANPDATKHELEALLSRSGATTVLTTDVISTRIEHEIAWSDIGISQVVRLPHTYQSSANEVSDGWSLQIPEVSENHPAVLMFTSGTTGMPKGVLLTHHHLAAATEQVITSHELTANDVAYGFLPLSHINAQVILLLSTLLSGGTVVLQAKFSASKFWPTVIEHQVTWLSAVPSVIAILTKDETTVTAPPSLRFVRSASAPLSELHHRRFEARFHVPIVEGYGMTEAAGQICINPLEPARQKFGSVGRPIGISLCILDDEGHELSAGQVGEISICRGSVIESYLADAAVNQKSFHNGWLLTGDFGYVDADGFVFIVGRKKELINRGGEKISPYEVEDVLLSHPEIRQAAAIGIADALLGEHIEVCVSLEVSAMSSHDEIILALQTLCAKQLSSYKRPSRIHILPELPASPTGKVLRHVLRTQLQRSVEGVVAPGQTEKLQTYDRASMPN